MENPSINTPTFAKASSTVRVLVIGAGPAGLLAAINLLRRNENHGSKNATSSSGSNTKKYHVTLVDPGVDYGALDEDALSKHRSWMIGLTSHGTGAIQEIPGLYHDYIKPLGVQITRVTSGIGPYCNFTSDVDPGAAKNRDKMPSVGFCVDRNYVCAALARYLTEKFGSKSNTSSSSNESFYRPLYLTRALFVDGEHKQVMVRSVIVNNPSDEQKVQAIEYDVLLGCDGIRSIVRNAFMTHHRDFEFDIQGNFGTGKSLHLTLPKNMQEGHFMFLLNPMPTIGASFVLPERGRKLNVAYGWTLNQILDNALLSNDPKVVAAFAKKHFKSFDMDCEEFGEQWTQQPLQFTQMVHCNFYHSHPLSALLLGDAAHATVPNLGQGMNTALADVSVLNRLLDTYQDNWEHVLSAFSQERVKEGIALTELSYNTFSVDPGMMFSIVVRQTVHRLFNKILPTWLLELEPINEIVSGMKLSLAYDKMVRYGYMAKSRQRNQDIKRAHFEKQVGLVVQEQQDSSTSSAWMMIVIAFMVAVVAYGITQLLGTKLGSCIV